MMKIFFLLFSVFFTAITSSAFEVLPDSKTENLIEIKTCSPDHQKSLKEKIRGNFLKMHNNLTKEDLPKSYNAKKTFERLYNLFNPVKITGRLVAEREVETAPKSRVPPWDDLKPLESIKTYLVFLRGQPVNNKKVCEDLLGKKKGFFEYSAFGCDSGPEIGECAFATSVFKSTDETAIDSVLNSSGH